MALLRPLCSIPSVLITVIIAGVACQNIGVTVHLDKGGRRADKTGLLNALDAPRSIPQILHQTYWTPNMADSVKHWPTSWRKLNLQWEARFYNDKDCLDFVEREFPQYMAAYTSLPKPVERADFFRYMVLLHTGGMYADVDTECLRPLDMLLRPDDQMVVSWEDEYPTPKETDRHYWVRPRQVGNYVIAAAAGHPVLRELCDRIAATATRIFDNDTMVDTALRTGAAMFTEVVLKHARTQAKTSYLRILPTTAFGNSPALYNGLPVEKQPVRFVLHHAMASWKNLMAKKKPAKDRSEFAAFAKQLFPVEMAGRNPFVMLLPLCGHGDVIGGIDVAAMLTTWGSWQFPSFIVEQPPVVDMLLARPGISRASMASPKVLLDIGAGLGHFSLAAAARGWKVISFELARQSLVSFRASVHHNGWQNRIAIHEAALGKAEKICVDRLLPRTKVAAFGIDVERGYGNPKLHAISKGCANQTYRQPIHKVVPRIEGVDAIRISVSGWEAWILADLKEKSLLQDIIRKHKPSVILVEVYPGLIDNTLFPNGLEGMIQEMVTAGYTRGQHMGYLCVEKRLQVMRAAHSTVSEETYHQSAMKQAGWCKLNFKKFMQLLQTADERFAELIVFKRGSASDHS